jgi:hypothetical protein
VGLDGCARNDESFGDLRIGETAGKQLEAIGQLRGSIPAGEGGKGEGFGGIPARAVLE